MQIRWSSIEENINELTRDQMEWALKIMAVNIQNKEIIDKFDFMDALKLGRSRVIEVK